MKKRKLEKTCVENQNTNKVIVKKEEKDIKSESPNSPGTYLSNSYSIPVTTHTIKFESHLK